MKIRNLFQLVLMFFFVISTVFAGINDGLVAYYPFNGDANDESGNGNNGTVNGAALTTDRLGNENSAYSFDGVNDYVKITPALFNGMSSLSIFAWVNVSQHLDGASIISAGSTTSNSACWELLSFNSDTILVAQFGIYGYQSKLPSIEDSQWHYVGVTFNGSTAYTYYDGIIIGYEENITGQIVATGDVTIGKRAGSFTHLLRGIIDDVRIYNRALSESEIDSLYHERGWPLYETGTVTDIDDNTYQTVKIGNQWWMAENLKTIHYRDGDAITKLPNSTVWSSTTEGAYCNYDNNDSNADTYGSLYNWYAINDSRGLAPTGWHVPTDEEWKQLEMYLGMSQSEADNTEYRGTDEGGKLKEAGTTNWDSPNDGATNESGFSALPHGFRYGPHDTHNGDFNYLGTHGYYWTSSEYDNIDVYQRCLVNTNSEIARYYRDKHHGYAVRCVRDDINNEDLVAYYPFNGNANDESGNVNNGIVNGATLTTDRFGNENSAYSFNGVDDYIYIGDSPQFNPINAITLSSWVNINEYKYSPYCNNVIVKDNVDTSMRDYKLYIHGSAASFQLFFESEYYVIIDGGELELNKWYNIVGLYDGYAVKLYINGTLVGSSTHNEDLHDSDTPLLIAHTNHNQYNRFLSGKIDDIRIYNHALTESEIDSLYHEGGWEQYIYVSVDSLNAFIGDTISIPVNVEFPSDKYYDSAELKFSAYQAGLEFIGVDTSLSMTGNAGWSNAVNETGDSLIISWFAGAEDISGSGVFCRLKFVVTGEPCNFVPINIESALFNTGEDSVVTTNGGVYIKPIPFYGDVDSNGEVQAHDAALILKHVIEVDTLDCQGLANADVTLNDTVTALDASVILQYGVGLIDTLPYDTSNGNLLAKGAITMEDGKYVPDQVVEVPLTLSGGSNILSFEGCLSYRPEQLVFSDIEWSQVTEGFLIEVNESDGKLVFAGAGSAPDGESGVFATVRFVINASFSGVETTVSLDELRWNEGAVKYDVAISTLSRGTAIDLDISGIPTEYSLSQNYPNPFNPTTTFKYELPKESKVVLSIFDMNGRLVETIVNQTQAAGYYSVQWDANDYSSGVYIYKLQASDFSFVKKCVLIK